MNIVFTNTAPEDKEWTAGIELLNKYTPSDLQLRHIVQYIRSGKFYPADMHVDLIEQVIKHRTALAVKNAYKQGYIAGGIDTLTNQKEGE